MIYLYCSFAYFESLNAFAMNLSKEYYSTYFPLITNYFRTNCYYYLANSNGYVNFYLLAHTFS